MSELNKDFETVAQEITMKLNQAAALVREAIKISESVGLEGSLIYTQYTSEDMELDDEKIELLDNIDVAELEGALDAAGWMTSSSYC